MDTIAPTPDTDDRLARVQAANERMEARRWKPRIVSECVATPEFVAKHKDIYEPPANDQKAKRDYGRVRRWYETMILKGTITREEHANAARDVDLYWHAVFDPVGVVGSYGDQRWNGTPMSQVQTHQLLGPEWRQHCRNRLEEATDAAGQLYDVLTFCIEFNADAVRVGQMMGYQSERHARRKGAEAIIGALDALAIRWGYLRRFHPPSKGP